MRKTRNVLFIYPAPKRTCNFFYDYGSRRSLLRSFLLREIISRDQPTPCKSDSRCVANVVVNVSRFERLRHTRLVASSRSAAHYARRRLFDVIGANEEIRSRPLGGLSAIYRSFAKARLCTTRSHPPSLHNIAHIDRHRLPS